MLAVPWLRRLVIDFLPWWPGFYLESGHMGFVVGKVALSPVLPYNFVTPATFHTLNCSTLINHPDTPQFRYWQCCQMVQKKNKGLKIEVKCADNSVFEESPQGYSPSPASFNIFTDDVLRNLDKPNILRANSTLSDWTKSNRPKSTSHEQPRSNST